MTEAQVKTIIVRDHEGTEVRRFDLSGMTEKQVEWVTLNVFLAYAPDKFTFTEEY